MIEIGPNLAGAIECFSIVIGVLAFFLFLVFLG